jgi:hypothetical protein
VKGLENDKFIGRGRHRKHARSHIFQGKPYGVRFDDVISGEKAPLGRILRIRIPHPKEPPSGSRDV